MCVRIMSEKVNNERKREKVTVEPCGSKIKNWISYYRE